MQLAWQLASHFSPVRKLFPCSSESYQTLARRQTNRKQETRQRLTGHPKSRSRRGNATNHVMYHFSHR